VQSDENPGLGHGSPPKRVDWTGPSQAVQSVRQSAPAREEHCPRALSYNARASPAEVALKHRRSSFCPANCRHAAHDLFGIGSGIGYVGGIRSSTLNVRAAPTGAGPMAVFPSTVSTVLTCGASTGTGSAGFNVPADAYVALGSGCVENEDQQSCRIQPVGAGDSGTADEEVRYPTMTLSPHY
jgi:hypothetical protein